MDPSDAPLGFRCTIEDPICDASHLSDHPFWRQPVEFLSREERIALAYERARLVLHAHRMLKAPFNHQRTLI
jgi:hypothetical protein